MIVLEFLLVVWGFFIFFGILYGKTLQQLDRIDRDRMKRQYDAYMDHQKNIKKYMDAKRQRDDMMRLYNAFLMMQDSGNQMSRGFWQVYIKEARLPEEYIHLLPLTGE